MKHQLVLQIFYSVPSVFTFLKCCYYQKLMSAFDWSRINNKCGFQFANRFAQHKFFKFFITKNN